MSIFDRRTHRPAQRLTGAAERPDISSAWPTARRARKSNPLRNLSPAPTNDSPTAKAIARCCGSSPRELAPCCRRRSSKSKATNRSTCPTWHGSPLDPENIGAHLVKGTKLCQIGDPQSLEARLVDRPGRHRVRRAGQKVEIMLDPNGRIRVHQLASNTYRPKTRKSSPTHLSSLHGGAALENRRHRRRPTAEPDLRSRRPAAREGSERPAPNRPGRPRKNHHRPAHTLGPALALRGTYVQFRAVGEGLIEPPRTPRRPRIEGNTENQFSYWRSAFLAVRLMPALPALQSATLALGPCRRSS